MPTTYGSFEAFTETITAAACVLRSEADVLRLINEIARDAARQGAVWVEFSVWPGLFAGRLGSDGDAIDTVLAAAREATRDSGVGVGVIVAANRDRGLNEACDTADLAAARAKSGVVGFGLDGNEAAHPPAEFAEAFRLARNAGLSALPHAGELSGPESVADALDLLGAVRVLHGIRAIEDAELTRRLAAEGVCLDVCPTSNVLLSVVAALEEHPLPALLAAGVRCSINADDPLLFDTDLLQEYKRCQETLRLTDDDLAFVARTSLEASHAPRDIVERALMDIDRWLTNPH